LATGPPPSLRRQGRDHTTRAARWRGSPPAAATGSGAAQPDHRGADRLRQRGGLTLLAYSPLLKGSTPVPARRRQPAMTIPPTSSGWPSCARLRPSWAPPRARWCSP